MDPPPYDQAVQAPRYPNPRRPLNPNDLIRAREQARFDAMKSSPEYASLRDSIDTQLLDPTTRHPRAVVRSSDWQRELRALIRSEYLHAGYRVLSNSKGFIIGVRKRG